MLSSVFILTTLNLLSGVVADVPFSTDTAAYNAGALGIVPNQTFKSSPVVAPVFQVNVFDRAHVDKTPYLFFDWRINHKSSAMIFRSDDLSLVYADVQYPSTNVVRSQTINGERYLTYWEGVEELFHGNGRSLVFNQDYELKYTITPVGLTSGRGSDEHEFQATDDGTVLITIYEQRNGVDLTSVGGPVNGILLDQLFQEIKPATGELVFQWRASDHFNPSDGYQTYAGSDNSEGFDAFHLNSVAKYGDNYLISSRYFHSIIMINGTDGSPIWILGGKKNQFEDLSAGAATSFAFQHHARLDGNQLTMFDNQMLANTAGCNSNCSRAMSLQLNFENMTVKLVQEYFHPQGLQSLGRGGHTKLPNGNALVAWGTQPAITEHMGDKVVMDIQVGRLINGFVSDPNLPYRAYKTDWVGEPSWGPSIAAEDETVYLSWNGATEVKWWVVLTSDSPGDLDGRGKVVGRSERNGFETEIQLKGKLRRYIRAAALNQRNMIIGSTPVVDLETGAQINAGTQVSSVE